MREVARDPAIGRSHRNADAVVLADEQHRRGQFLVRRIGRRIERGLRGRVVARCIPERADHDAVGGHRQRMADAGRVLDRDRRAQRLGQVRGDGRGLRQHPQRFAAPDLVPAAAGRVVRTGGEGQRRIHDRIHARQFAETLGHETATAVVQERGVSVAGGAGDHRIAFVAAGADRVEDLVLHAQHPRHQVEMAADQLRFEQFAEAARIERAAREDRGVVGRRRAARAVPLTHELLEVRVADLGAVEALHAGRDRIGNDCEHRVTFSPWPRASRR